jgi:peptidoglycan/xylan/chitin deacetylase (PgdA/CDA1 family)
MTRPPVTVAAPTSASTSRDLVAERILDDLQVRRAKREQRVHARHRRRLRQKHLRRLIGLTVPFLLALAWGERPGRVEVEGRTVWAWRTTNVARAVEKAGVQPAWGDLVDVRGQTLARGFGSPPTPMAGGRVISYAAPARAYRSISLQPGADRREATYEHATLLPAPRDEDEWAASGKPVYLAANPSVCGMARRELGSLSGLPAVVERAIALPIVAAGAAVQTPKRLALTFDDGPNGDTSREILSILRAHNAKATFFLLGERVAGGRAVVEQQVAEGHEIGNHSWRHPKMTRLSVEAALANIERAEVAISAVAGSRCRWFRPPYGETTAHLRKAILGAGYNIALWSVDTRDWQKPGSNTIYQRIMNGAKPGAVILMHDGGERHQTIAACRQAIPELLRQGYELVTLSELAMSMSGDDAGVMLLTDQGVWRAHVPGEPVHVVVGGRELPDVEPVLAMAGRILLPAPTILDALGADWEWDAEAQTVTVSSLRGRFRLRMDSERVQWDDREVRLEVPPILYHDVPLVPAQALARTTGARFDKSYSPMTLRFSFAEPVFSPRPNR